jgi:hypothetical protein
MRTCMARRVTVGARKSRSRAEYQALLLPCQYAYRVCARSRGRSLATGCHPRTPMPACQTHCRVRPRSGHNIKRRCHQFEAFLISAKFQVLKLVGVCTKRGRACMLLLLLLRTRTCGGFICPRTPTTSQMRSRAKCNFRWSLHGASALPGHRGPQ